MVGLFGIRRIRGLRQDDVEILGRETRKYVSMVSFLSESKLGVVTQNAGSSVCPSEEMIAGDSYMAS